MLTDEQTAALYDYLRGRLLRDGPDHEISSAFDRSRQRLHRQGACDGTMDRAVAFVVGSLGVTAGEASRRIRNSCKPIDPACDCEVFVGLHEQPDRHRWTQRRSRSAIANPTTKKESR